MELVEHNACNALVIFTGRITASSFSDLGFADGLQPPDNSPPMSGSNHSDIQRNRSRTKDGYLPAGDIGRLIVQLEDSSAKISPTNPVNIRTSLLHLM